MVSMDQFTAEQSSVHRRWRVFRICSWTLFAVGGALILFRAFWPGVAVFAVTVVVFIVWQNWSRRSRERLTAIAHELDAHRRGN
jgi:Flp pilus assembly protein TadB